jgi:hypothetical protein
MKVPPGTWIAETSPEKANRMAEYARNGPKSTDRRRTQAPMTMNGARTPAPTSVTKIPTAATKPRMRLTTSGPIPWPRSQLSVAGVVIEFHSSIERM